MVMPIGPLMTEHRLIERMIELMRTELARIEEEKKVNPEFIDTAVDFIRNYADRLHHGKEEDVLFRDLKSKELADNHNRIMEELIEEHRWGRKTARRLIEANKRYKDGDKEIISTIVECLRDLVNFYPKHIEKEDKHFFIASMEYFSDDERDAMLNEEWEFDQNFIHELYKDKVTNIEKVLFES